MKLRKFTKELFINLEKLKVNYCVVGKTFSKFDDSSNGDIDIITHDKDLKKVIYLIKNMTSEEQVYCVNLMRHGYKAFYIIIYDNREGEKIFHKLDICTDYRPSKNKFKNPFFIDYKIILKNTKKQLIDSIYIKFPDHSVNFVYYIIKKSFKRKLSKNDFEFIKFNYNINQNKALKQIASFLKKDKVYLLSKYLENSNFELFTNLIYSNFLIIQKISFIKITKIYLEEITRIIYRIKKPTGKTIAILGPDGSGKSTIINLLFEECQSLGRNQKKFHFWPTKMSSSNRNNSPVLDPHGKKNYKYIFSILKLLYCVLKYDISWFIYNYFSYLSSTVFYFDRYFIDIFADPRRYLIGLNESYIRFAYKFVIKPDILLIIDTDPKIVRKRKIEVEERELIRQIKAYRKLEKLYENTIIINGNQSLEKISFECKNAIAKILSKDIDFKI